MPQLRLSLATAMVSQEQIDRVMWIQWRSFNNLNWDEYGREPLLQRVRNAIN